MAVQKLAHCYEIEYIKKALRVYYPCNAQGSTMLKKAGGYPVFLSNILIERAAKIAARPTLLPGEKPSKNAVLRAAVRIGLDTLEKRKGIDNGL